MDKHNVICCRCEDVSLEQIHQKLEEGFHTFEDLKRLLRVGMGPCQGNTCLQLVKQEIAKFTSTPIEEVKGHKVRPLLLGVPIKDMVGQEDD